MPAIALIGPDGAGKTTLTRMLVESDLVPLKYLYMGIDIRASNLALPTSRWIERVKGGEPRHGAAPGGARGTNAPRRPRGLGRAWAFARLGNRIAEESFRQLASWYYQARGFAVLYDRHFVFDFGPGVGDDQREPIDKRLHRWWLWRFYPRPDLTIFLDAPGAVLFARKGELSPEELERRRQAFLRIGETVPNFVRVDATRPLPEVYADITRLVLACCNERRVAAREPTS
jgi:hypothetical protein